MTPDLRLIPTTPKDAELLARLHAESFGAAAWNQTQIEGSLTLDTTQGWVAFVKDQAAGFILCQKMPEQSEILTFCVAPAWQRRHIGEQLLDQTLRANPNLFLEVAADNIAAINLYTKKGFSVTGKRPNYYQRGETRVDAILLTLNGTRGEFAS